ncbi:MAG: AI-2E family transporter [Vicinamibacteria bacterium]|nr:AI-2E family transporter [Vicinamibacteria bacterium]
MTELGRRVLIGMAVLAVVLTLYVALPFAEALLMAAVLASAFSPWFERLARRLKQRRMITAGLFVTAVVFALVLPVVAMVLAVAQQADDAFRPIRATFQAEGLNGVLDDLPPPLPDLARRAIDYLPRGQQQVEELVRSLTGKVLGGAGHLFLATGSIVFQITMMLVGFFFLLVDGPSLVVWLKHVSPLTDEQMGELLRDFRDVSVAVLAGSVGTALTQTAVALLGYWIAGAPHALLLAAFTFIGAFIPVVGAGSISVLASTLLFFGGRPTAALFLVIWGVGVVSTIDNFVKPYLMRGRLEVNTGVIFFALLGGIATFGPIGLVAGPLVVAFLLAVIRICQKELRSVVEAEPEPLSPGV